MPPGIPKIIQSFTNAIVSMSNPFMPLLLANLILDTFTLLILLFSYKQIWICIPALLLWVFTAIIYLFFAREMPHMLSSTRIQKYGMQLAAGIGDKDQQIKTEDFESLPVIEGQKTSSKAQKNPPAVSEGRKR